MIDKKEEYHDQTNIRIERVQSIKQIRRKKLDIKNISSLFCSFLFLNETHSDRYSRVRIELSTKKES
jgi:hypothetical protein